MESTDSFVSEECG